MADSPSELQLEIEKLERKHAEHPEGRFFVPLANAYRKLGDVETAEALLRAGVDRHPDYLSAHIVLGRCLADRGAVSEAEEEFRFVLAQDPQNLIALRTLGELAAAERRTGEAAEWYRELLAVDPMNEDARQALEALGDAPASPEAETEFRSGAGWWEPAPEEAPEETASFAEGGWGETDLDTEDRGVAPAVPDDDLSAAWGGYDDLPGLREDQEPLPHPEPGAETHAELHADAGVPGMEHGGEGESEVVTETIAELYARQGLHDRAASVYRELIRRRGGDPALERRLAEVERLAGAEADAAEEPGLVIAPEERATGAVEPLAGLEPTAASRAPEAPAGGDPFAESFARGFGGEEEVADQEVLEAESEAEPFPALTYDAAPQGDEAAAEKVTIARFLGDLVAWTAAGPTPLPAPSAEPPALPPAGPEPEPEPVFGEELGAEPEPVSGPAAEVEPGPGAEEEREAEPIAEMEFEPAAAEDDSLPLLGAEPEEAWEHGTGSAGDDEPFPWELPGGGAPAEEPAASMDALPVDGSFQEVVEEESPSPAAEPQRTEGPGESAGEDEGRGESRSSLPDEDEDLESFQAWLRSLKR